jgi:pyruvate dehydrogenase E1 component alpha subunit
MAANTTEHGSRTVQLISRQGRAQPAPKRHGYSIPGPEVLRGLYRQMVLARRFDQQMAAFSRQGKVATYPSAFGQEAAEVGPVAAMAPQDWLYPTYRDSMAVLARGQDPTAIPTFFRGEWHTAGDPYEHRIAPQATPLATQALHAVGLAMAAKLKGEDTAALVLMGDGATSEGDSHEAFNFAGAWQAPCVFVVLNNGYAISVPYSKQTRARCLADRAAGYGFRGVCVDGNDAAAVFEVVTAALEGARAGDGPTLVEALTYRLGPHTNSDDPSRYREAAEAETWRRADPISRLKAYLQTQAALTDAEERAVAAEAEELALTVRAAADTAASCEPDPLTLFDHVYAAPRPALAEQRGFLARELAAAGKAVTA